MLPLTWEYPVDFPDLWFLPPRCKNPGNRVGELTIMTITDTDLHQAPEKTKARKFQQTIYLNTNSMRYCPKWHQKMPPARCYSPCRQISCKLTALTIRWKAQQDQLSKTEDHWRMCCKGKNSVWMGGAGERASEEVLISSDTWLKLATLMNTNDDE